MWFESDMYKRDKARSDKADAEVAAFPSRGAAGSVDAAGSPAGSPATGAGAGESVDRAGSPPAGQGPAAQAASAETEVRQEPGSTPMSLAAAAAAAAANIRREQEREQDKGGDEGEHEGEEVPEWWVFPFLLLTAAYSPWSGQAPSEWKHLDSSDGLSKKRTGGDVTVDSENPVYSPAVMSRLNPNGDALSRRQHFAAIKREKEEERKAAADKELQEARKEALETKKGPAALEAANTHVDSIGANMKRMVELKEAEAVGIKRENKIKALEKIIMLRLGDETENRAELEFLLNEC
ncbi:unnamed protein product [Ectocarpus sp. CCAP 1310/34]|nr:unnamed protein product [Ectocarpus sp. CCAP 1310/34]